MKIAIFANGLHRHTKVLADGLARRLHKVFLIYFERGDPFKPRYAIQLPLRPPKFFSIYVRILELIKIFKILKNEIDVAIFIGYPVIHALSYAPSKWIRVFMPITHPPKFTYIDFYHKMYENLIKKAVYEADVIVNVSNYMRKIFRDTYGRDSIVIPPPLDPKFKSDLNRKKRDKDFLILNVARFTYQKGQLIAIRMFKRLKVKINKLGLGYNVKLILHGIKGSEHYLNLVMNYAKGDKDIKVILHKNDKELVSYYQSATVFWWTIVEPEAFGMPPLEAMACGTPVISFDREPIREIVKDGQTGFVVKNVRDFIERTLILLENKNLMDYMIKRCLELSSAYSEDSIINKWENLLLSLI